MPSHEEALEWAANMAVACRCPQEVREFVPDPNRLIEGRAPPNLILIGSTLSWCDLSAFHERHIGWVLRPSRHARTKRCTFTQWTTSSTPMPFSLPGDIRNDAGGVAAVGTDSKMPDWMEPFARTIDAAKKYVVSSTLDRVDWKAELMRRGSEDCR